jgi:hypothetical protein
MGYSEARRTNVRDKPRIGVAFEGPKLSFLETVLAILAPAPDAAARQFVFIMMVPAFMVPDHRVSPSVEDLAANEESASKRKSLVLRRGFRSFCANLIRR